MATLHTIGEQKILQLSDDESSYLDACRARLFELIEETGIEPSEDADVFEVCDELIRMWHQSSPDTRPDPNEIISICGVVLGDHLCEPFELSWAICEDESGSDLCVFRRKNDLVLFPTHSVAKRFSAEPQGFMSELFGSLCDTVEQIK